MTRMMSPHITPNNAQQQLTELNHAVSQQETTIPPSPYAPDPDSPPTDWPQHLEHLTQMIDALKEDRELLRDSIDHLVGQLDRVMTQVEQITQAQGQQAAPDRDPLLSGAWRKFTNKLSEFRDWAMVRLAESKPVRQAAGYSVPWLERLADYLTQIASTAARIADTLQKLATPAPTEAASATHASAPGIRVSQDPPEPARHTATQAQPATPAPQQAVPAGEAHDPSAPGTSESPSAPAAEQPDNGQGTKDPDPVESRQPARQVSNGQPEMASLQSLLSMNVSFPTPQPQQSTGNGTPSPPARPPAAAPPRTGPQI